jgi:glycosyltransferase involved in cell wall biosynthesis
VLFVIDSLGFGGAERQLVELIKGLDPRNYEIHLITFDEAAEGYTDLLGSRRIHISYLPRAFKYDFRVLSSTLQYIRKHQIDLVHAFLNLGALVGVLAARLSGRPVVCSGIRDAKDGNLKLKISKKLLAILSDILVANSKAGFSSRFKKMKPHFRVIYNGVDFTRFQQKHINISKRKTELGLSNFRHIVGAVASLSERKDHDTLINAATIVIQTLPETCFLLIGDGPKRDDLTKKVKKLNLENNILFLGYRRDIDRLYNILDILVLLTNTDLHLEGISNAIIEAMAGNVPVIASEGGGTNELIQNEVNGLLVTPKRPQETAQAIIDLLNNVDKTRTLVRAAKISVEERFDLSRYVRDYEQVYRELVPNQS